MTTQKFFLLLAIDGLVFTACTKVDSDGVRRPATPIGFNYTLPGYFGNPAIPAKKLKIKLLDNESGRGVKDAVYYIKAIGQKANCTSLTGCDSLLYEDSVVTDADGNALVTKRGNYEDLRAVKGYWELPQLTQTYSFADYDSTAIKLWPEVWVKIQVKNVNRYDSTYLFSPRLECTALRAVYQPLVGINKDTTITQRLWAAQNYRITLNLYKNVPGTLNGSPVQVLKEFDQFIGKDTTEIVLSY